MKNSHIAYLVGAKPISSNLSLMRPSSTVLTFIGFLEENLDFFFFVRKQENPDFIQPLIHPQKMRKTKILVITPSPNPDFKHQELRDQQ
jgi:hypothetical protein